MRRRFQDFRSRPSFSRRHSRATSKSAALTCSTPCAEEHDEVCKNAPSLLTLAGRRLDWLTRSRKSRVENPSDKDIVMNKAFIAAAAFAVLTSLSLSGHAATQSQPAPLPAPAVAITQAPVNLNTADAVTLTRELKGIGATKAKAIIDYRDDHGPFSSVDELLEVKGIGSATLEKIRGQLSVQ
ncbi:helix-hairpin-helix domain-containing protein [Pseudomonas stutzeri]|nr:helix-hairpin-helix domain-containing protein [Stutzerimonas stutzeri]MCQ4296407.1 helix-hairpin-helix domain-containing protein [Stutzerimonas stutzeri]